MTLVRRHKPFRVARGVAYGPDRRRIIIEFDNEMFDEIRQRAIKHHTTFAEQVRTLVQWGLDEDEDGVLSDDLYPAPEAA